MEPSALRAGDTWKWRRDDLSLYPASLWTLNYYFLKPDKQIVITAVADGNNYKVEVAKTITKEYPPGVYSWVAKVSKDSEEYTVDTGTMEILPDLVTATTGYDTRSQIKKTLDAIEATLEGRATKDQQSYSIAGRTLSKIPISELVMLRDKYKIEYEKEMKAERIRKNLQAGGKVLVRFG